MNRMDAIEYFKGMRESLCETYLKGIPKDSVGYQATLIEMSFYDKAIKALEQKPCNDTISRQAAIDSVRAGVLSTATLYGRTEEGETARKEIERLIKDLHSVSTEKTGHWIPVSARLPSDDEHVIVSVLDDHGDTPWKYTTVAWLCNGVWISNNDILCGTVVAWMPLPQPYKAVGEAGESE